MDDKNLNNNETNESRQETEMEKMVRLLEEQKKAGTVNEKKDEPIVRETQESEIDVQSGGLCILSMLIPLVGIIYYIAKKKKTPKKASACLKFSFIGIVIGIALTLVVNFASKKFKTVSNTKNNMYVTQVDPTMSTESDDTTDEDETTTKETTTKGPEKIVSSETENYNKAIIAGNTITFPCSFDKFKKQTEFEFMYNSNAKDKVDGTTETWITGTINGQTVKILFYNSKLSAKKTTECEILGVSANTAIASIPVLNGTESISVGYNFDYLLKNMPKAEFKSDHFSVYTDKNYNELKVTAENGIVTNIELITNQK